MIGMLYERFKPFVWFIIFLLAASGAIYNNIHGTVMEALLNGAIAIVALVATISNLRKRRNEKK